MGVRAYTVEEIRKTLSVCSRLREKVIIHLLVSTRMRIGGIPTLKFGNLTPRTSPPGKVHRIKVYSDSSEHYHCLCNVETASVIDEYSKNLPIVARYCRTIRRLSETSIL